MHSEVTNSKYIYIVFSWNIKKNDTLAKNNNALVYNDIERQPSVFVKGYWQGFIDIENFRLFSIKDLEYPLEYQKNIFTSGIYTLQKRDHMPKYDCLEDTFISTIHPHGGENIYYLGIGKDGVIMNCINDSILIETKTALKHQNIKRLYESNISIDEVVNVVEDANFIGKAVKIALEYWQNDRDDSGQLCFLNVLRNTLKCKTPMQIQSMLLRHILENSYITCEELFEQGFSDRVIESINQ